MKYIKIVMAVVGMFFYSIPLYAQQDSFTLAVTIVEDYGTEQDDLLAHLAQNTKEGEKDYVKNIISISKKEKEETVAKLKNIRWLEGSADRLSKRVFNIVNAYTNKHIEALKELSNKLKSENKKELDSIIERAVSVRDSSIAKLKDTQKQEKVLREQIPAKEKEKPVPVIDTPAVEEPAKSKGIWER